MLNIITDCLGLDVCITLYLSFVSEQSSCGFVFEVGDDCQICDTILRISLHVCVSLLSAYLLLLRTEACKGERLYMKRFLQRVVLFVVAIFWLFMPKDTHVSGQESDGSDYDPYPIQLISPGGGENFLASTKQKIVFTSTSKIRYVRIEYSLDNGESWKRIVNSRIIDRPADYYLWEVPCTLSNSAKVRVSDPYGPDYDVSLEPFSIVDGTPPSLELSLAKNTLWPANGEMVDVGLSFTLGDNCDPNPRIFLEITSDEPPGSAKGRGGSQIVPDATIMADHRVLLRAERSEDGDGRVYVLTLTVRDSSGNSAAATGEVKVNVSQDREAVDSGQFYDATRINE